MSKISNEAAASIRLNAAGTLRLANELVKIGEHGQAQRLELVAEDLNLAASLLLECRKAERAARRADAERVILTFKVGELADGPTQEDHDAVQDIADVPELKDWEKELLGIPIDQPELVEVKAEGPTYVPVESVYELSTGDKVRVLKSDYTEAVGAVGATGTVDRDSNTSYARVKLDKEIDEFGASSAHLTAEELEKLVEPVAPPKEPVYVPVKRRSELSEGDRVRLNEKYQGANTKEPGSVFHGAEGYVANVHSIYQTFVFDVPVNGRPSVLVAPEELDKLVEEN